MLQPDGTATPVGRRLYLAQVVLNLAFAAGNVCPRDVCPDPRGEPRYRRFLRLIMAGTVLLPAHHHPPGTANRRRSDAGNCHFTDASRGVGRRGMTLSTPFVTGQIRIAP